MRNTLGCKFDKFCSIHFYYIHNYNICWATFRSKKPMPLHGKHFLIWRKIAKLMRVRAHSEQFMSHFCFTMAPLNKFHNTRPIVLECCLWDMIDRFMAVMWVSCTLCTFNNIMSDDVDSSCNTNLYSKYNIIIFKYISLSNIIFTKKKKKDKPDRDFCQFFSTTEMYFVLLLLFIRTLLELCNLYSVFLFVFL